MALLALYGGIGTPRGDYSGKTEQVIVETPETKGGGRSKRERRYPRWVVIDGQRYRVNSPDEERRLLLAMLDRARVIEATGTHEEVRKAVKRRVKLTKRVKQVDDSQWMQRLREIDEELVLFA